MLDITKTLDKILADSKNEEISAYEGMMKLFAFVAAMLPWLSISHYLWGMP
jgi:hypothetical protein